MERNRSVSRTGYTGRRAGGQPCVKSCVKSLLSRLLTQPNRVHAAYKCSLDASQLWVACKFYTPLDHPNQLGGCLRGPPHPWGSWGDGAPRGRSPPDPPGCWPEARDSTASASLPLKVARIRLQAISLVLLKAKVF